jgi:hypothetical protein
MEMHKLFLPFLLVVLLLCVLHVINAVSMVLKLQVLPQVLPLHQQPTLYLLLACAQPTLGRLTVLRAHSAQLTLRPYKVVLLAHQLLKLPATAMPTFMEMHMVLHALLALMAVNLLLNLQVPQLPPPPLVAYAQLTPMQLTDPMPLADAPLAELVLRLLRDPLLSLPVAAPLTPTVAPRRALLALLALELVLEPFPYHRACARLTGMETPQLVMHALSAPIMVSALPKHLPAAPAQLSLGLACVLKEPGELIPLLHAQLALLDILPNQSQARPLLLILLLLRAIDATPTILEMPSPLPLLPSRALPVARRALMIPLVPLPVPSMPI